MNHLTKTLIALFLSMYCTIATAADWIPYIDNHEKSEYGNGASTWRIASYGQWTLFANQRGMLVYDGLHWQRYQLDNRSEARGIGLFPKKKIIYIGGENEYSYFDMGANGALRYHCLSDGAPNEFSHVGNIFDFYEQNGSIYMRGDKYIIIRNGDQMAITKSPYKMFSSTMSGGTIYVGTDHGIYMIAGRQYVPLPGGEALKNKRINAMFSYGGQLVAGTTNDGFFRYDGKTLTPFRIKSDNLVKQGTICCVAVWKTKIAIGTIHNGLIIEDVKNGTVQQFDETNGLQNNTVLSVCFDARGNVWAGLSYGIDYVQLASPFTYLYRSPMSYGIGYSAQLKDGMLYLGTDRGLYYAPYPITFNNSRPNILPTTCPSGPAWYLYQDDGELFCMHDKGIFTLHGAQATRITVITGAWSCRKVLGHKDMMFVGVYDGMYLLRRVAGTWISQGRIRGIDESGRFFKQTGGNMLKIYNPVNGHATEYTLNNNLTKVLNKRGIMEQWIDKTRTSNIVFDSRREVTGPTLHLKDRHSIVPYDEGFMLVNYAKIDNYKMRLHIRSIMTHPDDSIVYDDNLFGYRPVPKIAYSNNSVRIEYNIPGQGNAPFKYQYRLNNDDWSSPSTITSKEYSDLHEGKYTFEVKAILPNGEVTTDSVKFIILTPWYRTWIAYIIYIMLLGGAGYTLYRLENKRIQKKQEQAVEDKNKEVKQMKVEIDKLEKDKIDLDLRHKSQEIANLILNITRKNEILQEIKTDVMRIATRMGFDTAKESKRSLLLINNKIDSIIEGDEVLKKFEDEFDLVNDNFMKKLSKIHPDLTHNDRLMCAYLKMNLTTKEIAPLLNISVRGLETNRYRLRKKLGLERNSSFTEYLEHIENTSLEELENEHNKLDS